MFGPYRVTTTLGVGSVYTKVRKSNIGIGESSRIPDGRI